MSDVNRRIGKAKASLVIEQPFLATLVCSLPLVVSDQISPPTLQTDGKTIWVHPQWVDNHSDKNLMWALGHEALHCVFKHMLNRGDRDPRKWNIAADYVNNQLLEADMENCRPENVFFDPAIYAKGGGTTEGVYNILPDDMGGGGGGGGPWDMVQDMGGSPAEIAEASAMWSVAVSQAAAAAKAQGRLSEEMERFVGELLNPKVPWEDVLRRFCMRQTRIDRSFARPSRRHLHRGEYMPGLSGEGMGDILIAVDQSGSVSEDELRRFASEMQSIKDDACPAVMHVLYFASTVMKHDQFSADEELVIAPNGTGGTAFSPIFRYAADNDINPDCCVVLTDLYCSDFGNHPDYPVLWCTTGADAAPWGEVISIRD